MKTTTTAATTPTPTTTLETEARDRLTAVVESLPPQGWDAASPCEGWTARDVLGHLVGAQRSFLAQRGLDVGPAPDLTEDPAAGWRAHSARVTPLVMDESVLAQEYDGHFGRTTVGETWLHFYVFDMVAHRWDIARAAGGDTRFTDDELDRIEQGAARFGPALYAEGVCRPGVEAPEGADRQTRALALLGRRP